MQYLVAVELDSRAVTRTVDYFANWINKDSTVTSIFFLHDTSEQRRFTNTAEIILF